MAHAVTALPKVAAIYVRISNDRGGRELGVKRQEQDCRALADLRRWGLAAHAVFSDNDISAGGKRVRPAYQRLLGDIESGAVDGVLAYRLDRLLRRTRELVALMDLCQAKNVPIVTVAGDLDFSSAQGRQNARGLGSIAEYEIEVTSERIRSKHLELAEAGKSHGGGNRPFGYEPYDKERKRPGAVRATEAAVIKDAARRILAGESMTGLVREWNNAGVLSAGGKVWDVTGLRQILVAARISGRREHHGEIMPKPAEWKGIIDTKTSDHLRKMLGPGHKRLATQPSRFLLTGFVECGRCKARLAASRIKNDNGARAGGAYACTRHPRRPNACGRVRIRSIPLDTLITEMLFEAVDSPTLGKLVTERRQEGKLKQKVLGSVTQIETDMRELARDHGEGRITRSEWMEARKPLERRLVIAQQRLSAEQGTSALNGFVGKAGQLRKAWGPVRPLGQMPEKECEQLTPEQKSEYDRAMPLARKRAIVGLLVDTITIHPANLKAARNRFDPARVKVKWRI